jgi:hypothetical protein
MEMVSRTNNVPEFSFATVSESEICDAVMSIRSDATGVDGIRLLFIKLLLPVVLPVLTHLINHIFVFSEFPRKLKTSGVADSGCYSWIFHRRLIWWCMGCCCASCEMPRTIRCWYAGGIISRGTSSVCEIWWSRIFCWGCDV